jgi:hypothetical protein
MKKTTFVVIAAIFISLAFASCKKDYFCYCTFDGKVVYSADLGKHTKKDAQDLCAQNDSTIIGEVWNCGVQ